MAVERLPVLHRPEARNWNYVPSAPLGHIRRYHEQLPKYAVTALTPLRDLADELEFKEVLIKDEGNRLGLPSFKILGASWGTYKAVAMVSGLTPDAGLEAVKEAAAASHLCLVAATDGNHGRAVARMAKILSLSARIYVPRGMEPSMVDSIRGEGARVVDTGRLYDDAIREAEESVQDKGELLIQDCGFDGYEDCPQWIVDGYSTMLSEIDDQLGEKSADLVVCPVGVGSLAQAVVSHYKQPGKNTTVMSVESDAAPCLFKSLQAGESISVATTPTINAGLECGTVSTTAWPILKGGISASVTVSDVETHRAVLDLKKRGLEVGPCGASGLAALRRLTAEDRRIMGLGRDSVAVLLSTERSRPYDPPGM